MPVPLCRGPPGAGTCVVWEHGKWEVLGSFALEATDGWGSVGKYPNLLALHGHRPCSGDASCNQWCLNDNEPFIGSLLSLSCSPSLTLPTSV